MLYNLIGQLTISRPQCSNGEKYIQISLLDKDSFLQAVEIRIPLDSFAEALTGLGASKCKFDFNSSGYIGKKHETKNEVIKVHSVAYAGKEIRRKAIIDGLRPYEVDGWVGSIEDAENPNRIKDYGDGWYTVNVIFHRYV